MNRLWMSSEHASKVGHKTTNKITFESFVGMEYFSAVDWDRFRWSCSEVSCQTVVCNIYKYIYIYIYICKTHQNAPVRKSLFNKFAVFKLERPQHGCFLVDFFKFLKIWLQTLDDCYLKLCLDFASFIYCG